MLEKPTQSAFLNFSGAIILAAHFVSGIALADIPDKELREAQATKDALKLARAGALDFKQDIAPLLEDHCTECHNPKDDEGNLDLVQYLESDMTTIDPELWEKVAKNVKMDIMPPPKRKDRPGISDRALMMAWGYQVGWKWDNGIMGSAPGRTTLRRLNKNEYNYTIRDLFDMQVRPADNFPEDSSGEGGFNNDADALFLPALLMENFFEAACTVADKIMTSNSLRSKYLLLGGNDEEAAKKTFTYWAPRIYRRNVESDEINRLVKVYSAGIKKGDTHNKAMRDPLVMMLVSPSFLYRSELPVDGDKKSVDLSAFELANRLSYFIWASMPDQELFKLANEGTLSDPAVLEAQVIRMLKDEKSRSMSMHLGGQWLGWEKLRTSANPDTKKFPEFDFKLRVDMYRESFTFFDHLLGKNGSIFDLLDSDYAYLNERLAKHYGIKGIKGEEIRKVALTDPNRGGVLGMGSVLISTSIPLRTSPSIRGAYVLENLLGDPPPSPPMDVEQLPPTDTGLPKSFRETLDEHRDNPSCRACHALIDPLGFGLENFDAVGKWRTTLDGDALDTTGTMPEGEPFAGPAELKVLLSARKADFTHHAAEKFLSYALGRELQPYDRPALKKITDKVLADNGSIQTLVLEIVRSESFIKRENPEK